MAGNSSGQLGNIDLAAFSRVGPKADVRRVKLAAGAGVCLHRDGASFAVEVHGHDGDRGYLLSMTQAEAGRIGQRLLQFAALVPGQSVGEP
ncbi:MAG: hypothetical protein ACOYLS_01410 [Polymorphobacter sp.]